MFFAWATNSYWIVARDCVEANMSAIAKLAYEN